jgi:hypothetical protein
MTRLLTLLSIAALVAAAPAAPVPKDADKPVLYYPVQKGTTWVYKTGDDEETSTITDVEKKKDGAFLVTISRESQRGFVPHSRMLVSGEGVAVVEVKLTGLVPLDEPLWVLKTPSAGGKSWGVAVALGGDELGVGKMTASGPEKVEVPAGTYQAVRVDMDGTFFGERQQVTTWYAVGVGKVKEVSGKEVEVLKSFLPGSKD